MALPAGQGAGVGHQLHGLAEQLLVLVGNDLPAAMQLVTTLGLAIAQRRQVAVAQDDRLERLGEVVPEQQVAAGARIRRMAVGQEAQFPELGDGPNLPVGIDLPEHQRRGRQMFVHAKLEFGRRQGLPADGGQMQTLRAEMKASLEGGHGQAQHALEKLDQRRFRQMPGMPRARSMGCGAILAGALILHPQPEIAGLDEGVAGLRNP